MPEVQPTTESQLVIDTVEEVQAVSEVKEKERLSSRKFVTASAMFLGSFALAWFRPEFVTGGTQSLFGFWVLLLGVYGAANLVEKHIDSKAP